MLSYAKKLSLVWGLSSGIAQFVMMCMFVQGFWFGSKLVREGKVSPGDVMAVFWACLIATSNLQMCIPQVIAVAKGKFAMGQLVGLVGEGPVESALEGGSGSPPPPPPYGAYAGEKGGVPPSPTTATTTTAGHGVTPISPSTTLTFSTLAHPHAQQPPSSKGIRKLRKITPAKCHGELALHNVTFAYPTRPNVEVLKDVSMYLPAREMTFIVGASGSGKSSIAQLLLRMYELNGSRTGSGGFPMGDTPELDMHLPPKDPSDSDDPASRSHDIDLDEIPLSPTNPTRRTAAGTTTSTSSRRNKGYISLDEQDVSYLDEKWVRSKVMGVTQSTCVILEGKTVFENVACVVDGATQEDVETACRAALIHEFVRDLPDGYETVLSSSGAGGGGVSLSGGQRQRLAFARARLRNPEVLILDEATSALDPTSRILVFEAMKHWRRNKTTIVITHDLSQIQKDDFVYVVKAGRVVEQGYRGDLERGYEPGVGVALGGESGYDVGYGSVGGEGDGEGEDADADGRGEFKKMMQAQELMGGCLPEKELSPSSDDEAAALFSDDEEDGEYGLGGEEDEDEGIVMGKDRTGTMKHQSLIRPLTLGNWMFDVVAELVGGNQHANGTGAGVGHHHPHAANSSSQFLHPHWHSSSGSRAASPRNSTQLGNHNRSSTQLFPHPHPHNRSSGQLFNYNRSSTQLYSSAYHRHQSSYPYPYPYGPSFYSHHHKESSKDKGKDGKNAVGGAPRKRRPSSAFVEPVTPVVEESTHYAGGGGGGSVAVAGGAPGGGQGGAGGGSGVSPRKGKRFSLPFVPSTPTSTSFGSAASRMGKGAGAGAVRGVEEDGRRRDQERMDGVDEDEVDEEEEVFEKEKEAVKKSGGVARSGRERERVRPKGLARSATHLSGVEDNKAEEVEVKKGRKALVDRLRRRRRDGAPHSEKPQGEEGEDAPFEEQPPPFWALIRKVIPSIPNKALLFFGLLVCILSGAMTPTFSFLLSRLLFEVSIGAQNVGIINTFGGIVLGIAALDGLFLGIKYFVMEVCGVAWVTELRKRAYSNLLKQDLAFFDYRPKHSPAKLVQVVVKDAEDSRNLVAVVVGQCVVVVTMLSVGLIWALVIGWELTLVGVAVAPVFATIMSVQTTLVGRCEVRNKRAREALAKAYYDGITNIRGIRALSLHHHFEMEFEKGVEVALKTGVRGAFVEGCTYGVASGLIYLAEALLFYVGAVLIVKERYDYLQMVEVLNLVVFTVTIGSQLMAFTEKIAKSVQATADLYTLVDLSTSTTAESRGFLKPAPLTGAIDLRNVTFAYPSRPDQPVLRNLNLSIRPGECVALVGASGCGKSTIAALLQRLYQPSSGSILLGGYDTQDMDITHLRSHLSVVSQHPHLFDASVYENIAYGGEGISLEDVERAARRAGAHEFVSGMEKGYETFLGEGGGLVSGGQAQRIQIARALARMEKNTQVQTGEEGGGVLVLDECTSALDPENQALVMDTIRDLVSSSRSGAGTASEYPHCDGGETPKMTTVMVTHKVQVMQMCDRIVVIGDGEVKEEGTFDELVRRKGVFASLASGGEWVSGE
ncbi:multidrug resistance protein 1, variant 2 [Coprinopsis cinerea AmutBmut pab1-1]|nr:multidrug resistance protein 1, variant 2 [Coprinopsis cinerea AmutBmut pab1-1]